MKILSITLLSLLSLSAFAEEPAQVEQPKPAKQYITRITQEQSDMMQKSAIKMQYKFANAHLQSLTEFGRKQLPKELEVTILLPAEEAK